MRKSLIVALSVLMGAALPWTAAAAQECQYHNVKLDLTSSTYIPPVGDYDFCLGGMKATGTINGTYEYCWYDNLVPSKDIFFDGVANVLARKYYSRIVTKKGIVDFVEWMWQDDLFESEYGMSRVVGGTGDFEGMLGTFYGTPRFPLTGQVFVWALNGYICTP